MVDIQKAGVIGCGYVGSTIAYTLMVKGLFSELLLLDVDQNKAEGEAMDISHGIPFSHEMEIRVGTYEELKDAALIIITAGANQKPGESRLELVEKNAKIMKGIIENIKRVGCEGILLIVANPVDILTEVARRSSGFGRERVIGSGTVLDTARLKYLIADAIEVDSKNIHAFMIGEHGDSEFPVWSGANVFGIDLDHFARLRGLQDWKIQQEAVYRDVRDSAYEIIEKKQATYYGIGAAVSRIAECIVRDSHTVLPISVSLEGEYQMSGISLSLPTVVGQSGAEQVLEIPLDEEERERLNRSYRELKKVLKAVE